MEEHSSSVGNELLGSKFAHFWNKYNKYRKEIERYEIHCHEPNLLEITKVKVINFTHSPLKYCCMVCEVT